MKIAAVKKFTQVLVAMAVAAVMAALLCAPKALGTTIGEFSIEQIYVNVPELDVFVQATDAQGQPISPDLVRAAGVELYLGDEKIPTGNIGMANEPICYVLAVDNSVDETTLKEYRIALRRLISAKGAKDQIMLYTLAGDAACVLPATIDTRAAVNAVDALESQEENEPNLVQAATTIYNDINENYQSIAPRKVIFALTEAAATFSSLPSWARPWAAISWMWCMKANWPIPWLKNSRPLPMRWRSKPRWMKIFTASAWMC